MKGTLKKAGVSENLTSVIFSGNSLVLDKLGAKPFIEASTQSIGYSNEGEVILILFRNLGEKRDKKFYTKIWKDL